MHNLCNRPRRSAIAVIAPRLILTLADECASFPATASRRGCRDTPQWRAGRRDVITQPGIPPGRAVRTRPTCRAPTIVPRYQETASHQQELGPSVGQGRDRQGCCSSSRHRVSREDDGALREERRRGRRRRCRLRRRWVSFQTENYLNFERKIW